MTTSPLDPPRASRSSSRRARLEPFAPAGIVLLLAVVAAPACRDAASANGTALLLSMTLEENLGVHQLRAQVHPPQGEPLRPPLVPEIANGPLGAKQSLRLLLPDSLGGQSVVVTVEGLVGGKRVAKGDASVDVRKGREVEVTLSVRAFADGLEGQPSTEPPADKDLCRDLRCGTGQRCVEGECLCDATSCSGCCQGNVCIQGNSASACGSGGAPCDSCPADQRCQGGVCEGCNATSCPDGCCSGSRCLTRAATACAADGGACRSCGREADACSEDGRCVCGDTEACGDGQRCEGGRCVCDETTCAGCCVNEQCLLGAEVTACGSGGGACIACESEASDNCTSGLCGCGVGPACAEGLACIGGACECTEASCTGGCCREGVCRRDIPPHLCGAGSEVCAACDALTSDNCQEDACRCGEGPSCGAGYECVSGQCLCTRASCAGCCQDGACLQGNSVEACGRAGAECGVCEVTTANSCAQGGCRCGRNPACSNGQVCDGSRCVGGGL